MKKRKGFVGNSSSSSFVIATRNPNVEIAITRKLSSIARYEMNTLVQLDEWFVKTHHYYGNTVETILAYFAKKEGNWLQEEYEKFRDAILAGKTLFAGTVANDYDDSLLNHFYTEGFPESDEYEILEGE